MYQSTGNTPPLRRHFPESETYQNYQTMHPVQSANSSLFPEGQRPSVTTTIAYVPSSQALLSPVSDEDDRLVQRDPRLVKLTLRKTGILVGSTFGVILLVLVALLIFAGIRAIQS